jgi:hypothetical protein
MTVKVYLNDGSIEEYPNAYVYWEWDESEKGTDSGFRINSMDRNFTSAVAFVYPGDCTKIEITSEKCDRVFKSPPREDSIPVKRWKIFRAIHEERIRQNEKWGEQNHEMLKCESIDVIKRTLRHFRLYNESPICDWYSIIEEEIAEAFVETDPEKQRMELIQVAAVAIQIIEYLDRNMEVKDERH